MRVAIRKVRLPYGDNALATKKAVGLRGSWFAHVDGEPLPCVHKYWVKGLLHHDPFLRHKDGLNAEKIRELAEAVERLRRVVLTDDAAHKDTSGVVTRFTRKGYIAVYEVEDVSYSEDDGLRFKLAKRLHDLM